MREDAYVGSLGFPPKMQWPEHRSGQGRLQGAIYVSSTVRNMLRHEGTEQPLHVVRSPSAKQKQTFCLQTSTAVPQFPTTIYRCGCE